MLDSVHFQLDAIRIVFHERIIRPDNLERLAATRISLLDGLDAVERSVPTSAALEANHDRHRNSVSARLRQSETGSSSPKQLQQC